MASRAWDSVSAAVRGFPYALFFSATASAVLVVIVGLLIAFMQYQARLLRVQPQLTAAQVVQYVATSNRLQQRFVDLDNLSNDIAQSGPEYNNTLNEVRFRIDRICALFQDDSGQLKSCRDFLYSIPFAGSTRPLATAGAATGASAPSGSAFGWLGRLFSGAASEQDQPMSPELSKGIRQRFIEIMGGPDRKIAGATLPELVALYTWDMEEIAKKNLKFWLSLYGPYTSKSEQYRTTCENVIELAAVLSTYRQVDVSTCTKIVQQPRLYPTQQSDVGQQSDPAATPAATPPKKPAAAASSSQLAAAAPDAPVTATDAATATPPTPPASDTSAADTTAPSSGAKPPMLQQGEFSGTLNPAPQQNSPDRQMMFELVTNYSFYDQLLGSKLQGLLISPTDFLALALVCFGGVLGALLRIVFFTYVSGRDPNVRNIFIGPILGLICALVVYILFRAGFIVITDRGPSAETATLSPFVIAIMSMSAGLLSERAIDLFQRTSGTWLGSAEATQASRWAVRLQQELDSRKMSVDDLAQRLDVSSVKLGDWAAEKDMVPIDKQREIALVLGVPLRQLFTDLPPAGRPA